MKLKAEVRAHVKLGGDVQAQGEVKAKAKERVNVKGGGLEA